MPQRIGDFLVGVGAMTKDQVENVLKAQKDGDGRMFGEIAIERGYVNDAALKAYVNRKED